MLHYFSLLAGDGLILTIFVLGVLALPYSPDMRKMLGHLPGFGEWVRRTDAEQFALLQRVHGNAYQLMIVVVGYSIKVLIRWFGLGVAVLLAYDVANLISMDMLSDPRIILLTAALAFGCPILGLIQWIFWTRKLVIDLREYDEAVSKVGEAARARQSAS